MEPSHIEVPSGGDYEEFLSLLWLHSVAAPSRAPAQQCLCNTVALSLLRGLFQGVPARVACSLVRLRECRRCATGRVQSYFPRERRAASV